MVKIKLLFSIFLFACILVSGCGENKIRATFQQRASGVLMDTDPANVKELEMYLPKGYIEYIPDSREYTKTTVTLPSGKEKEVVCPYAQKGYKKNELEELVELSAVNDKKYNFSDFKHYFINYEDWAVLYIWTSPTSNKKEAVEYKKACGFKKLLKEFKDLKKDLFYLYENDLSSRDINISFFYGKLRKKERFYRFVSVADVATSTGYASIWFYQAGEKTYNDFVATLLSIKPASQVKNK